jgi:4-hydroxy-tetrahydrodipicolinate synthase
MNQDKTKTALGRRAFLQSAGAVALGSSLLAPVAATGAPGDVTGAHLKTRSGKPFRGLYPIMATPFTPDDKLDTECLANEVKFLNKGKVNGMIWPVFASSWSTLSDDERILGAETILAANKGGKSAVAIAVQNMQWDVAKSVQWAKHAAAHGADAIVAIPPNNGWDVTDQQVIDYYKAIGGATNLPLIMQTRGTIQVPLMLEVFKQVPTFMATKDEVGDPMQRISQLMAGTNNKLSVWAAGGGTGADLMKELPLGFEGLCPTPQYAEFLQQAQELYWAGKTAQAYSMWATVQEFATIPGATDYMLVLRGVFKEDTKQRQQPMEPEASRNRETPGGAGAAIAAAGGAATGGAAGGRRAAGGGAGGGAGGRAARGALTAEQKQTITDAFNKYLKPYTRG